MRISNKGIRTISITISAFIVLGILLVYTPLGDLLTDIGKKKTEAEESKITVKIEEAAFGSRVSVSVGNKYKNAKKYQIFEDDTPISALVSLSEPTTIFPEEDKKAGDKLKIKLVDEKDEEIAFVDVKLTD